jgi:hypothetical protein
LFPSARMPVPASTINVSPLAVRVSTHEVCPPYRTVAAPGTG